jgi:GT2 family glycosyltransferase
MRYDPSLEETQSAPRVTALVVSRNDAGALRRCLEHLQASQGRENIEVLITDDGSEDTTPQVPHEFEGLVTLRLPKQLGWTRATNIGLRTAKGDSVLLLPQNAFLAPDVVPALADRLENDTKVGAVCPYTPAVWPIPSVSDLAQAVATGDLPGRRTVPESEEAVEADYPLGAPIMVRRTMLKGINYLDARFGDRWADLELCWRIRSSGKSILVLPQLRVEYGDPGPTEPGSQIAAVDNINGLATLGAIHYGAWAGIRIRLGAAGRALTQGQLGAVPGILSGQKIDGNHL